MEEILKTTLLEYDKSTFLVDLIRHDTGALYIEILQTMQHNDKDHETHTLKINPNVLDDIIEVLMIYKKELSKPTGTSKAYFSKERKDEIIKRYLKGIEINDLATQFDCAAGIIEQILRNNNIEIVSNKLPVSGKKYWRRKR